MKRRVQGKHQHRDQCSIFVLLAEEHPRAREEKRRKVELVFARVLYVAEHGHIIGGVLLHQLRGVPKGDAGVQHLRRGDAAHGVKREGGHRAAVTRKRRGRALVLIGLAIRGRALAPAGVGVVVLPRFPRERGPAHTAE